MEKLHKHIILVCFSLPSNSGKGIFRLGSPNLQKILVVTLMWEGGQPGIYQIISERMSEKQNPNLNCTCRSRGYLGTNPFIWEMVGRAPHVQLSKFPSHVFVCLSGNTTSPVLPAFTTSMERGGMLTLGVNKMVEKMEAQVKVTISTRYAHLRICQDTISFQ